MIKILISLFSKVYPTHKLPGYVRNDVLQALSVSEKINILILPLLAFMGRYPRTLATLDLDFFLLSVVFTAVILPLMLSGKIPAYYSIKNSYPLNICRFFIAIVIFSCAMRVPITYTVYYLNIRLSQTAAQKQIYIDVVNSFIVNPKISLVAIAVFALLVFLQFYLFRERALTSFYSGKDNKSNVFEPVNTKGQSQSGSPTVPEFIKPKVEEDIVMRRQSRM